MAVGHRYLILCAVVFSLILSHYGNLRLGGDFWQHSAAVLALMIDPTYPPHPVLSVSAPHPFFTPYHVAIAHACRLTGFDNIHGLMAAGLVNTVVLFGGTWLFGAIYFRRLGSCFYLLLFTLVFWWPMAWGYSGFLHLRMLGDHVASPSTLTFALFLLSLAGFRWIVHERKWRWGGPLCLVSALILTTHPLTGVALFTSYFAFALDGSHHRTFQASMLVIALFAVSAITALLWPLYPFLQIAREGAAVFHQANAWMYRDVLLNLSPIFAGAPVVAQAFRRRWRSSLPLMLIFFVLIYTFGFVSGQFSYGRVISFAVLAIHVMIADWVGRVEYILVAGRRLRPPVLNQFRAIQITVGVLAVVFLAGAIYRYHPWRESNCSEYAFLSEVVSHEDVVLADLRSSRYVPSYGGKVVAFPHAVPLVPDHPVRRLSVERFFSSECANATRREIIAEYDANFVLLRHGQLGLSDDSIREMQTLGRVVYKGPALTLVDVGTADRTSHQLRQ